MKPPNSLIFTNYRAIGIQVYAGNAKVGQVDAEDASNRYDFAVQPAKSAKYVELKNGGTEYINVAEVEVYGTLGVF